jgi:aldose 1-epimerase
MATADTAGPRPPSGTQHELRHGRQRAVVVEVGGGLREYEVSGRHLLDGYPVSGIADGGRGQLLAPWPNRVRNGRYRWQGRELQLDLSEPERGNAIHGLCRWSNWSAEPRGPAALVMRLRLAARPSYPFTLDLAAEYRLGDDGLVIRQSVVNRSLERCPYASGCHPYLAAGTPRIDPCSLQVPAATRLVVDDQAIPIGRTAVAGSDLDFRSPRQVGDSVIDTAYTDLERDEGGIARVTLRGPEHGAELWLDDRHRFVMVFSGDTLQPRRRRQGLAVEPMTAAPDAFNSGDGLVVLQPGEEWAASWGIRPL